MRSNKDGEPIRRFDTSWEHAVRELRGKMISEGVDSIKLNFHDLRRSAHHQMRMAGIDAHTRRAIMGHRTGSMDDRYAMIDDESFDDAKQKMEEYHQRKHLSRQTVTKKLGTVLVREKKWSSSAPVALGTRNGVLEGIGGTSSTA